MKTAADKSALEAPPLGQAFIAAWSRFAGQTFAVWLPVFWLVALIFSFRSGSLFLSAPFGGLFPFLFFIGLTFAPRTQLAALSAALASAVLPVILLYVTDGHAASLALWPFGLALCLLFLHWLPPLVFAAATAGLHFWIQSLPQADRLWRLETVKLQAAGDPAYALPALGLAVLAAGAAAYGRHAFTKQLPRWSIFHRNTEQLAQELAKHKAEAAEARNAAANLELKLLEHERQAGKLSQRVEDERQAATKLENQIQELRASAERQQQEHQRKLVQALTEGVQFRALTQAGGLLFFRLTSSGEVLSTNEAAGEIARKLQLKQIGGWILPDQPQLAKTPSARNWLALRGALLEAPCLLKVQKLTGGTAWVWASVKPLEQLAEGQPEEWALIALELDAQLTALSSLQSVADAPALSAEKSALIQQEQALRRVNQELLSVQKEQTSLRELCREMVAALPLGAALLDSIDPPTLSAANDFFLNRLTQAEAAANLNRRQWAPAFGKLLAEKLRQSGSKETSFTWITSVEQEPIHLRVDVRLLQAETERKQWLMTVQDQSRLHQAESLFEEVAESSPAPFLIAGMNSRRIIYANSSLRQTLGFDVERLTTLSPDDLMSNTRQRARLIVELKRKGSVEAYPVKMRDRKGRELPALCTLRVAQLLGERCILGSFVLLPQELGDIKSHESTWQPAGAWLLQLNTLSLTFDADFIEAAGIEQQQLKLHEFLSRHVESQDTPQLNDYLSRLIQSQSSELTAELEYRLKGAGRTFRAKLFPVLDDSGFVTACRAEHLSRED